MKQNFLLTLSSIFSTHHSRVNRAVLFSVFLSLISYAGFAQVTVTPATGGTGICANSAQTGSAPAFTTLGPITVTEGNNADLSTGFNTLTLSPPAGWRFGGAAPTTTFTAGRNIIFITVSGFSATSVTFNIFCGATTLADAFNINNLQVQALTPSSLPGNIFASSAVGISGIVAGAAGTNFGSLSLTPSLTPSVTISASPSGPICAGTGVAFTPVPVNGGASPTFNWFVNGGFVGSGAAFSTSTLANGNTVIATMASSATCISAGTVASNTITMTVNPVPAAVTVSGSGTFCNGATLTASGGAGGTIFFQGATSGGTSTVSGGTPQVVTSSGTYYFRSGTALGCWGTEGSATVTINPGATANAGTPQSVCAGGTITLAGSIGGSATSSTWSAPSGTFSSTSSLTSTYTPSILSGTVTLTLTTNDPDGAGPCVGAISTVLITVNAIPNPVIVTGAGTFCNSTTLTAANGGSGTIFFQGTTSGGTSTVLGGTPQTITTSGTYFFRAQGAGGCWGTEGSAAVTINAGATANAGTGQIVCAGGTITLAGSIGGTATSSTWSAPSGTFSAPGLLTSDYTPSIPSGTVTLTLTTDDPDGGGPCPAATSTVITTVNPLPNAVTVSPAGVFCNSVTLTASGGAGGTIFFQGTTSGGTSTSMGGSPQTVTASGRYFFRSRSAAGCWGSEGGSTVTINPLPTAFNVTGGGGYCFGGGGVDVGLSSTESGVNYRLFRDGLPASGLVAGTFAPISFGVQTTAGVYTVQATNATTGCTNTMTGSVTVSINPLPTLFTVSAIGPTSYCSGGAGVPLILSGSTIGVNYQVMLAGSPVGSPVAGTGIFLFLGTFTGAGAHTVIATNTTTGCTRTMTGSVNITVNPLPTAFSVTGGGGYCAGGTGVPVGLANSSTGVSYQLFRDGTPVGAALAGSTGSALNFGLQTGAGTYTVTANNTSTFCQNTMTGSVVVTINPLPALYTVTGGGSYCTGGTGVSVGLGGSDLGVNYQLFAGATLVGTLAGTGAALDFGLQTVAGTYIVVATDATTLCVRNMTGSVPVNTLPLPTAFTVTGGGSYCTGGPGVDVILSGSTVGVTYELFNLFTSTGITVAGTGGAISFGFQTVAGFYTVVATNTVSGCVNNMTGGVAVALIPLPTAYTVTGGGGYCVGGVGSLVGLSGSDAGVDYQLFNGVTPVGLPVPGTGAAISFGPQTLAGAYTVVATDATTTCVNNMTGFVVVTINLLPNTFAVTGGGIYCEFGTGVSIGLAGSDVGVNYQLFEGVTPVGSPMAGTGAALDFGLHTVAGSYTVVATDATTGCTNTMTGFALVIMNPAPFAYTVIGGGPYCTGGTGVNVGLSGSDVGIDYQLFFMGSPIGSPLAGTGLALDFGLQTGVGTYTVEATNTSTLCARIMAGSVTISINPLPNSYTVLGGGLYCVGGAGVDVSLSNSDIGVNYQLMNGASPVGSPMAGTGALISFGFHTTIGTYTVVATDATTGCSVTMSGSATIATNPLPTAYSMTGGGAFCVGGTGVSVGLSSSDIGIAYQLYEGTTTVGTPVTGTGLALDFGLITTPGIYTVQATNTSTTCTNSMSGFVTVSVTAYPVVSAITGSSTVCQGSNTTLANATPAGVWSSGSTSIASVVSTTGVVNGVAAGTATITYTVTNGTGCATSVTTNITVLAAPTVAAITGLSSVCQGLLIHLSNATPGGTWSSDNTAIATISTSGNVTGVAPGIVNISYTVTSGSGCSASAVLPITVGNPMPTAALIPAGTATLCGGNPVTLNVLTSDSTGITYSWYLGSVLIPGETNSNYFATSSGVYTARIDNGTCYQEFSGTNVMDPPVATITLDTFAGLLFTGAYSTYQWYMNGTAIPGATSNNVTVGPVGSIFTVVVTDINGCTDTSDAYIIVPLPISVKSVIADNDIRIYPNPATSVLHIDAPAPVYVSVFTADGRVLIDRKEAVSINVSQLADGMYMIKVYDENNNLLKTDKFIKVQ
ncbi:MAG: C-terminal target protein [Flavipsychrobacter sp.]|jgi:hypothetical protein|nr:C-terminal target protein [Flavipsychrobacter sp.]